MTCSRSCRWLTDQDLNPEAVTTNVLRRVARSSIASRHGVDLDGPVQGLDPGLVGRGARAFEVLGDHGQRQELARRARGSSGAVVGDRKQDRAGLVVGADVDQAVVVAGVDGLQQTLGLQRGGERELDLGRSVLTGNDLGDPLT